MSAAQTAQLLGHAAVDIAAQYLPGPALRRVQAIRARAVVAHAYAHVPFYREGMRRAGLTPADVRDAGDLAKLPLVERDGLQRDPERFVPDTLRVADLVRSSSGGSSGRPVTIFRTRASFVRSQAVEARRRLVLNRVTRRASPRIVSFGVATDARPDPYRHLQGVAGAPWARRIGLRMEDEPADHLATLAELAPDVVSGYGSYVEELFATAVAHGGPVPRPRAVLYGADPVSRAGRELIAGRLGLPLISRYGTTEVGAVGGSCERAGDVHVDSDVVHVRPLEPTGGPGEIVVSRLVPQGSVILNYRIGDHAVLRDDACPCGRSTPLLGELTGRRSGWLARTDGGRAHDQPLRSLLSDEPGVLRWQLVQRRPGEAAVTLVTVPETDLERARTSLAPRLADLLGPGAEVAIHGDRPLWRNAHGKAPPIVRL